MVELIGLVTMAALIRLLDFGMANESEAERRRLTRQGASPFAEMVGPQGDVVGTRVAA
jgi:hypothetical protein